MAPLRPRAVPTTAERTAPAAVLAGRAVLAVVSVVAMLLAAGCTATTPLAGGAGRPTASASSTPGPTATPGPLPGFTVDDPPPVISHGPRTRNLVALTFDADMTVGMAAKLAHHQAHSYANLRVLDILERQHVPATFFLTGMWVQQYPDVTRRLAANPDVELANHTYSHRAYTPHCYTLAQVPAAEMAAEIVRTFAIIRPYGGRQTDYFRFPGLCTSAAALAAIAPTHVTVIQGDVVSGDPGATAPQPIVRAVLTRVRPGSIVVMHITEDNARMTDRALPAILAGLRQKGLQPVRLSQLLEGEPAGQPAPALTAPSSVPAPSAYAWSLPAARVEDRGVAGSPAGQR